MHLVLLQQHLIYSKHIFLKDGVSVDVHIVVFLVLQAYSRLGEGQDVKGWHVYVKGVGWVLLPVILGIEKSPREE